jgi:hypothetical protein
VTVRRPLRGPTSARTSTRRRVATAGAAFGFAAAGLFAAAAPALAVGQVGQVGDPGGRLTWVQTVLIYVGIPVAVAVVIAFLVYLPSLVRGPRYRPGRPWTAGSVWFGGPGDAPEALAAVTTLPPATVEGGGASARW